MHEIRVEWPGSLSPGCWQHPWIVSIPGTRSLKHLDDSLSGVGIGFTEEEKTEINAALSRIAVSGARYPVELEKRTGK